MQIALITLKMYVPWVHSLKEKRMEVKSICAKLRTKFNVSVAETDEQDKHQIIIISVCGISPNTAQSDSILDNIINFVESNSEAEVTIIEREIL